VRWKRKGFLRSGSHVFRNCSQVILRDTAREPDLRERFAHLFDDLLGIGDFEIELIGHSCLVKKQAMIQRH